MLHYVLKFQEKKSIATAEDGGNAPTIITPAQNLQALVASDPSEELAELKEKADLGIEVVLRDWSEGMVYDHVPTSIRRRTWPLDVIGTFFVSTPSLKSPQC